MFVFMIKVLVAVVLTAIPFIFQGVVKPRQANGGRWKNLYVFVAPLASKIRKIIRLTKK